MQESDLRSRPIIEVKNVRKEYPIGDETVVALKRINLNVSRGRSAAFSAPPVREKAPCSTSWRGWRSPPGAKSASAARPSPA